MYTYKNKTNNELVLVGVGKVAPNQEFRTAILIENPNIELIQDRPVQDQPQPVAQPAPAPQPVQAPAPVTNQQEGQQL